MNDLLTIEKAAKYLGITPQTLRNWDKSGKLKSVRDPSNNYRLYHIDELNRANSGKSTTKNDRSLATEQDVKRFISKLHNLIRDLESNSNIVDRFDELSKLLFLKLSNTDSTSTVMASSPRQYAEKIHREYKKAIKILSINTPAKFTKLNLNDESLYSIGQFMEEFDFTNIPSDLKGIAYEEMIKNTFEKGDNQQFFTPNSIVDFICNLMTSFISGTVGDPASGTGSFLIKLLKEHSYADKLLAFEIDERLSWISSLNLLLHGCNSFESLYLKNGGSLGPLAEPFFGKLDVIITNPPFGSEYSDMGELNKYTIGKGKASRRRGVLFIERCLSLLKNNGWLAIIIDDGVLNSPSNSDIRELIVKNSEIHAVVALPSTTFMPYATVQASILILKKTDNPGRNNLTLFAKSERVGKKTSGDEDYTYLSDGTERLNSDLPDIQEQWVKFLNNQSPDISKNIYTENIFNTFESDADHNYRLDFAFHHPSRHLVKNAISLHYNKLVRLDSICNEINDSIAPSKGMPDETILYTGLAHIESNSDTCFQSKTPTNSLKSSVKRYEKGDILFSKMRPELRKSVAIDFNNPGYCSSECIVFRIKDIAKNKTVTPRLLAAILRSDFVYGQIVHLIAGIGRPRISVKELRKIMIPIPSTKNQKSITSEYLSSMEEVKTLKQKANLMLSKAEKLKSQSANIIVDKILEK